jgi:histidinol-phosphate aminotransferase
MVNINGLVRENILKLTPYSCARDEFSGKSGIFLDANENPYGELNRYPDPYQRELKAAISLIKGAAPENIFLGNGSDEIIDLCFRIFCRPGVDKTLIFTPTYGMYEVSATINDVNVLKVPLDEDFQIDIAKVRQYYEESNLKLIMICSPNNPTGNSMDPGSVESVIAGFRGIVLIDEAYIDFSDKPSFIAMTDKYPNLIVMQTFSKASGLAAARIGMAFANSDIIHLFNKVKPPYNISTINQRAALKKLSIVEKTRSEVKRIIKEKVRLSSIIAKMKITERIYPSDANFILVRVKNADYIYNTLVDKKIIVRNRSSIINNCLRITIGKRSENDKLIDALNTISI